MITRRKFIHHVSATGLAFGSAPWIRAGAKGRKYRSALIGTGWWGMNILKEAMASGRIQVAALCDVDPFQMETAAEEVMDLSGEQPKLYKDFRDLLDKEKIDIVIIATPDHWHALNTIAALKSGAHVFVEKPTGHTILESRAMVQAVRNTGKTVQVGLHRRIGPHHISAMDFLKSGKIGKVGMVRMFAHGGGGPEKPTPNGEPPEGMDWNLYCGPAPLRPYNRRIHPGGFRNFLDFANGTLGDWGVHWLDQVLWWTDEKYPKRVYSTGGRPIKGVSVLTDKEQTTDSPDSQVAVYEFESFTATWEHRRFASNHAEKHRIGCYFYGEKGTLHIGWRDGWSFYPSNGKYPVLHQ
jgi:predicted dehydrogenase